MGHEYETDDDLLTPEQWAEIEARLDSGDKLIPHNEVERLFHKWMQEKS